MASEFSAAPLILAQNRPLGRDAPEMMQMTTVPPNYARGFRAGHRRGRHLAHRRLLRASSDHQLNDCPCRDCDTIRAILRRHAPDVPMRRLPTLQEALELAERLQTDSATAATAGKRASGGADSAAAAAGFRSSGGLG